MGGIVCLRKFGRHIIAVHTAQEKSGQPWRSVLSLNITQGCQNPTNIMAYAPAAKTDKPTDWKALWISFGDGACSKKNDSHGSDLSFTRSSWRGECGLSNDGTCLRFPFFCIGCCGEDDRVVDVAEIPVPTVIEKLFSVLWEGSATDSVYLWLQPWVFRGGIRLGSG